MAAVAGITTVKTIPYRGNANEKWSNTYHFDGPVPANPADWRALFDALVAQEKTVMLDTCTVVQGYGYATDNPDDHSVWTVDLTAAPDTPVGGLLTRGSQFPAPGDAAAWVRWKTSRTNTRGKPIYLRKYFHGCLIQAATGPDSLSATQRAALVAFASKMYDGTFVAGRKIRSQLHPDTIVASSASTYITTRTLKRRGRRPH